MKTMKKVLAVVLALTMLMGMSVTTFASTTIPVTFSIDSQIAQEDLSQAIALGYDATVVAAVQNGTYGSLTRNFTFDNTSNGLAAIQNAGNQIISGTVVTGTTSGGDTTIDKVFTLPTIDIYGDYSWTGYYWQIYINGITSNNSPVRFESPEYAADIPLGTAHTYYVYDVSTGVTTPITCTVTSLEIHYVKASYYWGPPIEK